MASEKDSFLCCRLTNQAENFFKFKLYVAVTKRVCMIIHSVN